jgi:DNA-binding NtrC family response regulator/tetratricopeptide (TPR) repeat protein
VHRFERERAAIRRGDLREAHRLLLGRVPGQLGREDRGWQRVLLAEVLLLIADRDEAVRLASAALEEPGDAAVHARAHVVCAVARADVNDVAGALAGFQAAVVAARETGVVAEVTRAQVRLWAALTDRVDSARLAGLVPDVRHNLLRAGDPHLSAHFYISEGRVAAKLGAFDRAWQHFDLAAALLPVEPNHVLDAVYYHSTAALCALTSDRVAAVHHGRRALYSARQAGYTRLVPGASCNLAIALLHLGHVDEAEVLVEEALQQPALVGEAHLGLLDTKAQVCLLRGDVAGGLALLDEIDHRVAAEAAWDWAALSRRETRVRLALADEHHALAAALAADGRAAADERGDAYHATLFTLLEADACISSGNVSSARRLVEASAWHDESESLLIAAERERLRTRLAVFGADRRRAVMHARRARRLIDAVGTAQQRDTLARQVPEAFDPPRARRAGALDPPPAAEGAVSLPIDLVSHLVASAARPTLLAQEAAEVLRGLGAVRSAQMVVTDDGGRVGERRLFFGPASPEADWRGVTWPLGRAREGEVTLHVWVHGTEGLSAVASLGDLVSAAVALVAERRRVNLLVPAWPDEPRDDGLVGIFGHAMRSHLSELRRAAATSLPVLVTGETGTGKELVAREVHRLSRAATGAFVPFNCAAIPREMLESQLFGHRRGAFTGAASDFGGVVREAARGTLFLDEIGELDLALQPKLLRFLETGEIQRLGEARPLSVDVRTIAATNADVDRLVRGGGFREDLFYRLNVVRLHLPPLRDRREDVPVLITHFLERFARETSKPVLRLNAAAIELLTIYDWPGNVRELSNEMRRLTVFAEPDREVEPERLSLTIRTRALEAARRQDDSVSVDASQSLAEATVQLERTMVARAFKLTRGKVGEAASLLGLSRKGLFLMRRRLGLD